MTREYKFIKTNYPLTILYVGHSSGTNSFRRMKAIIDMGHNVTAIETVPKNVQIKQKQLLFRIIQKIFGPIDLAYANRQILKLLQKKKFDVIWLDKSLTIDKQTLYIVRQIQSHCKIVGYSPDDMYQKHNQSKRFLQHLPYYDIFFTTKSYNVKELIQLGGKQVEFIDNTFDLYAHSPVQINDIERIKFGGQVGFIGAYEKERAESIYYLAKNGIKVRVWGSYWDRCFFSHKNIKIETKGVWGSDYSKAICSFDINLCFLRKINRDLQTTRSIEIPACGAFMLAERTDEHLALFEEGKEAEFFSSDEELIRKVRYYLEHPDERRQIAKAGRERCLKSGYSNHDRVREMIEQVKTLS